MIKLTAAAIVSYATVSGKAEQHLPVNDLVSIEAIAAVIISIMLLPVLRKIIE